MSYLKLALNWLLVGDKKDEELPPWPRKYTHLMLASGAGCYALAVVSFFLRAPNPETHPGLMLVMPLYLTFYLVLFAGLAATRTPMAKIFVVLLAVYAVYRALQLPRHILLSIVICVQVVWLGAMIAVSGMEWESSPFQ